MTCAQCGMVLAGGVGFCGGCGAVVPAGNVSENNAASGARVKFDSLAPAVWKVLKVIMANPVDELPNLARSMEPRKAMETGIALAALFDLCAVVGLLLLLPRWAGSPGIGDVLKMLVLGAVPGAAVFGAIYCARRVSGSDSGTIETDALLAGASLIPNGLVLIAAGVLGLGNLEITGVLSVFALSYTVLILFAGCTKISGIATVKAVPAVPVIVLIALWLSKVLFATML